MYKNPKIQNQVGILSIFKSKLIEKLHTLTQMLLLQTLACDKLSFLGVL